VKRAGIGGEDGGRSTESNSARFMLTERLTGEDASEPGAYTIKSIKKID
jgi:hypothetical protein